MSKTDDGNIWRSWILVDLPSPGDQARAQEIAGRRRQDEAGPSEFQPKSMLHAAETKVPRSRYPVIDVHTISVRAKLVNGVGIGDRWTFYDSGENSARNGPQERPHDGQSNGRRRRGAGGSDREVSKISSRQICDLCGTAVGPDKPT